MAGSGILYPKYGGGGGVVVVANPKRSSDGWTNADDYADFDTKRVWISDSIGNDANDGLTRLTPKKTINAGKALMRPGFPDQLLFKPGDTWTDQRIDNGNHSGRDAQHRRVFAPWPNTAGARPKIRSGVINTFQGGNLHDIAILGLNLDLHGYTGIEVAGGVSLSGHISNFLVENCLFSVSGTPFQIPLTLSADVRNNVVIRRNVFLGTSANAHFIGLYKTNNVLIEENFFDNMTSDWSENVQDAHAIYAWHNSSGIHVRRNVFTQLLAKAARLSGGGICEDNVVCLAGGGFQVGGSYNSTNFDQGMPGGVKGSLIGNLVTEMRDITSVEIINGTVVTAATSCFHMENLKGISGAGDLPNLCRGNIAIASTLAQADTLSRTAAIMVEGRNFTDTGIRCAVEDLIIEQNKIVDWLGGTGHKDSHISIQGFPSPGGGVANITVRENDFQDAIASPDADAALYRNPYSTAALETHPAENRFFRAGNNLWFDLQGITPLRTLSGTAPSFQSVYGDLTSTDTAVTYADRAVRIAAYNATIGGLATTADYIARCRAQDRSNWDTRLGALAVLAYFRAGLVG